MAESGEDPQAVAEAVVALFRNDTQRVEGWLMTITQLKEMWKRLENHEKMNFMAKMLERVIDKVNES